MVEENPQSTFLSDNRLIVVEAFVATGADFTYIDYLQVTYYTCIHYTRYPQSVALETEFIDANRCIFIIEYIILYIDTAKSATRQFCFVKYTILCVLSAHNFVNNYNSDIFIQYSFIFTQCCIVE